MIMSAAIMRQMTFKGIRGEVEIRVSSTGRIYDLEGEEYPQSLNKKTGYYHIYVRGAGCAYVHRIVCAAFHPVEGMEHLQCDHIDNNKSNNHQKNLRFLTRTANNSRPHARKMKTLNHKTTVHSGYVVEA